MIRLLFSLLVVFSVSSTFAQSPESPLFEGRLAEPSLVKAACNEAGSIASITNTTDGMVYGATDTIFLCFGESLEIDHAGDASFPGDPDPATTPGVGYIFYNCIPTVEDMTVTDVAGDQCLVTVPTPTEAFWIAANGQTSGDLTFTNDGGLQNFFNGGAPLQLHFAPATFDALRDVVDGNGNVIQLPAYEGDPSGECIDVRVDQFFSVVYLNEIVATNVLSNLSNTGCEGSFEINGGLPGFDSSERYTYEIHLVGDSTVTGTILNGSNPAPGTPVRFYVPQPGDYEVTVSDAMGCSTTFIQNMVGCEAVTFELPLVTAEPNSSECVPLTVSDFNGVASFQFSIAYDPTVITYTQVVNFNAMMPDLGDSNVAEPSPGNLTVTWLDFSFNGVTLPNDAVVFEICFDVIGDYNDCSALSFTDEPTDIEVNDVTTPMQNQFGFIGNDGKLIISDDDLFVLIDTDSVRCNGEANGSFTLTVGQGQAPYTVSWRDTLPGSPTNGPFQIATTGGTLNSGGLTAGVYEIVIMDSGNPALLVLDTIEIVEGPSLGVLLAGTPPSCNGEMDGSMEAIVSLDGVEQTNPVPGYSYMWNLPDSTGFQVTGLGFGNFDVTVTDPNGCTTDAAGSLSQPAPLNVVQDNIVPATCSGTMDGSITVSASGGTTVANAGQYKFVWNTAPTDTTLAVTAQLANLNPGDYTVSIFDDNGCSGMATISVPASKTLQLSTIITDVSCFGEDNGAFTASASTLGAAAVLPYTLTYSDGINPPVSGQGNPQTINGLSAGTYFLTLTDNDPAGCVLLDTLTISQPDVLAVAENTVLDENCTTPMMGSITVDVTGGTFPYSYNWDHDATLGDSVATMLGAGMYELVVTDNNLCTDTIEMTVNAPLPPQIVSLPDDTVSCPGDTDGVLTVVATDGNAPIVSYAWSNGTNGPAATSITGLGPDMYIVTITAADNCVTIDTAFVDTPNPLTLDSINFQSPTCPGDNNGQAAVFVSGGTTPYTYTFSSNPGNPTQNNLIPGLSAGDYSVTISDASGCDPLVADFTVSDPPAIVSALSNLAGVSCPDDTTADGAATVTANYSDGTAGSFMISWSSGETANMTDVSTASQLMRGMQFVTISDGVCGVTDTFEIASPDDFAVGVNVSNVSCNAAADGGIGLDVSGATGPYSYVWLNGGQVTDTIGSLNAGVYNVIITDANNCTFQQNGITVTEPDELSLTIDTDQTTPFVTCDGDTDGVLAVNVNTADNINPLSGAPFTWSNGIAPGTSSLAANLGAGTYGVTVTDVVGCTDSLSFTIAEPTPIVATLAPIAEPPCFGEQTSLMIDTILGGTGTDFFDYTYIVDNNGLEIPPDQPAFIFGGPHVVTVMDPSGCTVDIDVTVNEPLPVQVIFPEPQVEVELGDTTFRLTPQIIGAVEPYDSLIWTPMEGLIPPDVTNPIVIPFQPVTNYQLQVIDANGCTGFGSVVVELDANRNVYIPNVFSPNNDGINDEVRIFGCLGVESLENVQIFDRWGDQLFERGPVPPDCLSGTIVWDGTFRGKPMNTGVYVVVATIRFLDGQELVYRRAITLLR